MSGSTGDSRRLNTESKIEHAHPPAKSLTNGQMVDHESHELLNRIRHGDEQAAVELLDRFSERLIDLARSRLSRKLARRIDPEDIVQSACRSFFRLARAGRFELDEGAELWHLLATITINKTRNAVRRHTAQKRTVKSEESHSCESGSAALPPEALAREPSPEEAVVLVEETERMMGRLTGLQRQIVQLRMQGYTITETSQQAECAERTVRRAMELAKLELENRLCENHSG